MTQEEFINQLKKKNSAPFLFVGSGFSRHYLDFPDWRGILSKFAPKHINEYSTICQTNSLPRIASEIAKDLNAEFWALDEHDGFRIKNQERIKRNDTVFKIKISEYLINECRKEFPDIWKDELELLKNIVIDGIITTNWDDTVERIFPNYKPYIGQQELISASTFNIGEIYKIHGCMTLPESLVLTQEDYDNFNQRNAYLAAKLITIFIEHPVIFIGYSINDDNIRELMESIVQGLDEDGIAKLQSNLIFVEWNPYQEMTRFEHVDLFMPKGTRLPIIKIITKDFSEVYKCLSHYERKLPANVLREYKKQFYNLIVSQKANSNLYVLTDNQIDGNDEIQVVYGFGAIKKFRDAVGYTGVQSYDIYCDCINNDRDFEASKILQKSIPQLRKSSNANLPIYKYLTEIGILDDDGYCNNSLGLNFQLPVSTSFACYKSFNTNEKKYTLEKAIATFRGNNVWKAVALIPYLHIEDDELESLRLFISENMQDFLVKKSNYSTYMRKLICFYDCLKYGWKG
ncbi:SIR2 family protein [uncultured Duncaniella sp.]|uniref:SIR2 family protein n=2 Tax=uncultured Duncaniella sp. TaxID=2768039 RepID=UPI00262086CB|nr:SIR2 family protein [uncultured Duncaniella sp.]